MEKLSMNVVTPVSRPEHLAAIHENLAGMDGLAPHWFTIFDPDADEALAAWEATLAGIAERNGGRAPFPVTAACAGHRGGWGGSQRSAALERIAGGWCFFLDDDNVVHPEFVRVVRRGMEEAPGAQVIVFHQVEVDGRLRLESAAGNMHAYQFDTAQFVIRREFIEERVRAGAVPPMGEVWPGVPLNDWNFIRPFWESAPEAFHFVPAVGAFYNALRGEWKAAPTIEVRIVTGCRETYRAGMGLPPAEVPVYLEATVRSILQSDVPREMVTVHVDSLGGNRLSGVGERELTIVEARYGVEGREMDVTERVREGVKGNAVFLCAGNGIAGGDPAPGVAKRLVVRFALDGVEEWHELAENHVCELSGRAEPLGRDFTAALRRIAMKEKIAIFTSTGGGLNTHLPEVLRHPPRAEYLLVLEDDVEVDADIFAETKRWLAEDVPGLRFGSLYNVFGGRATVQAGEFYSAQALVLRSDVVPELLCGVAHYDRVPGAQPGWMDIILSRIAGNALGAAIDVHPRSLVRHIGVVSKWK